LRIAIRLLSVDWSRSGLLRGSSGVDEAATFAVWAASSHPEGPADLRLVLGMTGDDANVLTAMGELTLGTISAALLFFPVAADLGLVQANFAVMSARSSKDETIRLVNKVREWHLWLRVGVDLPSRSRGG
jgi:hypothetical protein